MTIGEVRSYVCRRVTIIFPREHNPQADPPTPEQPPQQQPRKFYCHFCHIGRNDQAARGFMTTEETRIIKQDKPPHKNAPNNQGIFCVVTINAIGRKHEVFCVRHPGQNNQDLLPPPAGGRMISRHRHSSPAMIRNVYPPPPRRIHCHPYAKRKN
eukprot:g19705.t1